MNKSFLQTQDWLLFQKSSGKKVWHFNDGITKANIIKHPLPFGRSFLYVPHGPEVDFNKITVGMRNASRHFGDFIKNLGREENAIFIKLEPMMDAVPEFLHGGGLFPRWSPRTIQPHRTLVVDITADETDILAQMHHKTRYNIGLAQKKGLVLKEENDVDVFWDLLKKTTEHDNFSSHPKEYYSRMLKNLAPENAGQVQVRLYTVLNGKTPVVGAIMLTHNKTVYYLHGAMDRDARNLMGPYLMHWELMKKYKKLGYDNYDFWGINSRKWPGVTRFKMGFGGRQIEYPGAFDIPVSRLWFLLYRLAKKLR